MLLTRGALEVSIAIENGGKTFIQVADNGSGMSEVNAFTALQRFGTSKIQQLEDLDTVQTFGFRGEALPSISSVSRFKLTTAAANSPGIEIELGGEQQIEEVICE